MIEQYEIAAWLGDTTLTDEQLEQFTGLVIDYEATIANRDGEASEYVEEDTAAWVAALEIVEGTFDLRARGQAAVQARTDAYQGAIMATLAGESEVQAAEQAAISRPTLRKALGK